MTCVLMDSVLWKYKQVTGEVKCFLSKLMSADKAFSLALWIVQVVLLQLALDKQMLIGT